MERNEAFSHFPKIETDRYLLREITLEDAPVLFDYLSDKDTMKYMTPTPVQTIDEVKCKIQSSLDHYTRHREIHWVITNKHSKNIIGTFCFHKIHMRHLKAEMGVVIGKAYQKQGVMTEILAEALRFGFETLGLNRIVGDIFAGNEGSAKLLEKHGFKKEGVLRQTDFDGDKFHDTVVYSLLKEEFVKPGKFAIKKISIDQMMLAKNLLSGAAMWLKSQNINQWGHLLTDEEDQEIKQAILKGETYIVYKGSVPVATFNLNMSPSEWDQKVWGDVEHDAIYLHRLTVHRDFAGQNIGGLIFQWVHDKLKTADRTYLRLDCVGHNDKLNLFYKNQGFEYIGESTTGFSKYQKLLSPNEHPFC